jgi:LuxR family maltose regulon positive regulatory protein
MDAETALIETKLFPPRRRSDLLVRSRLIEFVHEHIENRLLLLCAPAGYGKTTLLVDYIHDLDIPVCWLSLDESDRDPVVFLDNLLASLRGRFPDFAPDVPAGPWTSWDEARLARMATALVSEMRRSAADYFLIILDDYHLVNDSEIINTLLDRVLADLPENCQVIISSRTEPTLTPRGLALLAAQRQVAALGVSQLRFTALEIKLLIAQNYQQTISDEAASLLAQESEGWITGILLTARGIDRGFLAVMSRGLGKREHLYDYLADQVLARQPPPVRRFLEETAVLSEMGVDICDELRDTDNSDEMLSYLEQQNLFIFNIHREDQARYRYHHLFREFLLSQLEQREPLHLQALHLKAGDLLRLRRQWDQALQHYLKCGAPERAAELVIEVREELRDAGRWQTLGQWLDLLPEGLFSSYPQLMWIRGRVLTETGAPEQAVDLFERAYEGLVAVGDHETAITALHDKAVALRFRGHLQSSLQVLHYLLGVIDDQAGPKPDIYPLALCEAGIVSTLLGDLKQGNTLLRQSLQEHEARYHSPHDQAVVHDALGTNLMYSGNLTGAQIQFERALRLWESLGNPGPVAVTLNNLGVIHSSRADFTQAMESYERALHEARRSGILRTEAFALASIGDVHCDVGDLDEALAAYANSRLVAEKAGETQLNAYLLNAVGEAYRRQGNYVKALELARRGYEWAQEHNATVDMGRCATTLGAISYAQGRTGLALRYLDQASNLLTVSQANRELAIAHLHRAQTFFQTSRKQDALAEVEKMVDCLLQLGYGAFLVPVAAHMRPLLNYAVEQGVGLQMITDLLDHVDRAESRLAISPQTGVSEAEPVLRIQAFGPANVQVGDRTLTSSDWRSITSRDLFFYLLCEGPATKEKLADTFWPDLTPGKLRSTFHITVYRLRRALDPLETVIFEDNRYHFNRRLQYDFDVETFESLLVQAEAMATANPALAIQLYLQAIDLYHGDFLEDYAAAYDEWRVMRATELSAEFLSALECTGNLFRKQDDFRSALDLYSRAVKHDPFRESARRGVMLCLVGLDRRADALRYYQDTARYFHRELGTTLTHETAVLYRRILSQVPLVD